MFGEITDIIFFSFGLFILGLVLLFAAYDIFLRLWHFRNGGLRLMLCCLFLLIMGLIFLIFSLMILSKLYALHQIMFYTTVLGFSAVALLTFQIMKWKREVVKDNFKR